MPITVFDSKGILSTNRERIERAVLAAGKHTSERFEGWLIGDPGKTGFEVRITGAQGFDVTVRFDGNETEGEIAERLRVVIEEEA